MIYDLDDSAAYLHNHQDKHNSSKHSLYQEKSLSKILLAGGNLPIEQTMAKLEKIAQKTPQEMSEKQFDREDSKIKYLLHKYAYEDVTTEEAKAENLRALKRPRLVRPKNRFTFPFSKPNKSLFPEIPYDKGRKFKAMLRNSIQKEGNSMDYHNSSNFSSVSQVRGNSELPFFKYDEKRFNPKSAKVSADYLPEDTSRMSVGSTRGRGNLYKLLDGTSYLQARPGHKLPELKTTRKKASPYNKL